MQCDTLHSNHWFYYSHYFHYRLLHLLEYLHPMLLLVVLYLFLYLLHLYLHCLTTLSFTLQSYYSIYSKHLWNHFIVVSTLVEFHSRYLYLVLLIKNSSLNFLFPKPMILWLQIYLSSLHSNLFIKKLTQSLLLMPLLFANGYLKYL